MNREEAKLKKEFCKNNPMCIELMNIVNDDIDKIYDDFQKDIERTMNSIKYTENVGIAKVKLMELKDKYE